MTTIRNLTDLAHSDIDAEIAQARQYAGHFDAFIEALANTPTTFEQDVTCLRCGRREIFASRDPKAPAEVFGICRRCSEG